MQEQIVRPRIRTGELLDGRVPITTAKIDRIAPVCVCGMGMVLGEEDYIGECEHGEVWRQWWVCPVCSWGDIPVDVVKPF